MIIRCMGCMDQYDDQFSVCPCCGYVKGTPAEEPIHMAPGTLLYDRYIVGKVLGYGGFGVTYIGWDGRLEQKIAVKEYLPSEFSTRMPGESTVTIFNGDKGQQFSDGMKKFVEEAKHLAKFQNENGIVKIFDSFEENETAYIIMEYLDGMTLTEYLKTSGNIPEDLAVQMLVPVMESLETVHKEGLLHRDIAPDNIFITKTGEIKLIDFGASRYATTSHSRSLTVIIKPGYSPEEQYRSRGDQGPYTDVYAIAATLYKMLTGKTPPDAMERRAKYENDNKDILVEPHKLVKGISLNRENAILNAMNVRIQDRTPDIGTFMHDLTSGEKVKRVYGKIKKIDLYRWPKAVKIGLPALLGAALLVLGLVLSGIINFNPYTTDIVIPDGIVAVPDVENEKSSDAEKSIQGADLLVQTVKSVESQYIPAGTIIYQMPVAGTYMDKNSVVQLVVSSGKQVEGPVEGKATVPYLLFSTIEEAVVKLEAAGMDINPTLSEDYSDTVPEGQIISQSIEAGTEVTEGTNISLVISKGTAPFELVNVQGSNYEEAKKTLENLGLKVTIDYSNSPTVPENNVISQSIGAGTMVKKGDTINLTVSSGTGIILVTIENVVGNTQANATSTLKGQGFKVVALENYDNSVPEGCVISQNPEAGKSLTEGTEVVIYISKGKQPVNITMDPNGGSGESKTVTAYVSNKYDFLVSYNRTGYSFTGWFTEKNGGSQITANTVITEADQNKVIFANWKANEYTVSFDSAGGSVCDSISVVFDGTYEKLPTPNREGYGFAGWYTSDGTKVENSTIVSTADNHQLTAKWTAGALTVSLDPNGGSVSSNSINVTFDGTYGNIPDATRTGYKFEGWYTSASGGTKVTSSSKVDNSKAHTLYAHWTANSVKVTLNANGGSCASGSIDVTYDSTYGNIPDATRTGYKFEGWYTKASGGTKIISSSKVDNDSTHTLYAHWSANSVNVTLDANGGSCSTTSISATFDGTYGTLPDATRTGYKFEGWYTKASGGTKITSSSKVDSDSAHTLYAHWSANSVNVTLDANGGSCATTSISATFDGTYGTLPDATRTGYKFEGWYTSASGGTKITSSSKVDNDSAHTIYAHWSANSVNVTLDANGGNCSTTSISATFDGTYGTLPDATRTGYKFEGWYTSASGGTKVISSNKVNNANAHTLYAHWTQNTHVLSFNLGYETAEKAPDNRTIAEGAEYGQLPAPTRDYYTFLGWYSGSTKVTSSTKMGDKSLTLTAKWEENALSGWVLESQVPAGASIRDQKWTYTLTTTTESKETSLAGYTQISSRWVQSGSGSANYSTEFHSGFDTSNYIYTNFYKSQPFSAYETATTKRTVSTSWAGYVYWHWMYNVQYASGTRRAINPYRETASYSGFKYGYFAAFTSSSDCSYLSNGYCNNYNMPSYNCHNLIQGFDLYSSTTNGWGTDRFFRFNYYTCSYVDYYKLFKYQKTETKESTTAVTAGGNISNVQKYVKYVAK